MSNTRENGARAHLDRINTQLDTMPHKFTVFVGGKYIQVEKTTLTGKAAQHAERFLVVILGLRSTAHSARERFAFVVKSLDSTGESWLASRRSLTIVEVQP